MTRFGKQLERSLKDLTAEAVNASLRDAGCEASVLESAYFSNTTQGHMQGQHSIRGEVALRAMGIGGIPVMNVENACASGSSALLLASHALRAGAADVALAVGAEKLFSKDREKMFAAFDSAWDVETPKQNEERLMALCAGFEVPPGTSSSAPYSRFMDIYAAFARAHMRRFGTTQEQIAAVAAKNHQHSVHNPLAQYQKAVSIEEVLAAPPITYPLTLPMCAPISDGAAAVILCTEAALPRFVRSRAIELRAAVLRTGSDHDPEDLERHASRVAALAAYRKAGIGPEDVDVAEVHDATAVGEILQIEHLGFVRYGEGGPASLAGETRLGGRIPVNPSGGLESKGHPLGATGLAQIFELVSQLRGEAGARQVEGARVAVAENGGGLVGIEEAVCSVTVLSR
jgi:acetyl-CoA acetyltransferase